MSQASTECKFCLLRLMFTLAELSLKFPNNLGMLSNIQNNKIPKFQQIWIKTSVMFVTTNYCEDWVINTVFKVLKHLFLKSVPGPLPQRARAFGCFSGGTCWSYKIQTSIYGFNLVLWSIIAVQLTNSSATQNHVVFQSTSEQAKHGASDILKK